MLNLPHGKKKKSLGFTPHSVSRAVRSSKSEKRDKPQRADNESGATVSVNLDGLFDGLFKVARFMVSRHDQKRARRAQELDTAVLKLAAQFKGFLGLPDLLGYQLCDRREGEACLERLRLRGECLELCDYEGEPVYVFPSYLVRVWECHYCDSTFPVAAHHHSGQQCSCGRCGGDLELAIA